ncbi:MAG: 50S ribosomal protein L25/general stress protein Ctc [Proteobacteria bacterium]|jgi:large subunit ribosomal protein L25|nr:50S ribosomal protein L25/general stress protein Ctc [Pseudomonadota bacterium]MDA0908688.1 50S ribosomal protein L25/general stress protein Ctc [Pseudomonadota bacterium]
MSETIQMSATKRDRAGKGSARAARRSGLIPAVIYGGKTAPETININDNSFRKLMSQPGIMSHVIALDVEGKTTNVLPRDIQFHPVTDAPLHVDFLRITASSTVMVMVPVVFTNEDASPGLKGGGVLNIVRHEIEMSCSATSIPESLTVDLTGTEIGDSVHISAVSLPENTQPTITDRDFTIATIAAPTVEVEVEETVEEETAGESEEEE